MDWKAESNQTALVIHSANFASHLERERCWALPNTDEDAKPVQSNKADTSTDVNSIRKDSTKKLRDSAAAD